MQCERAKCAREAGWLLCRGRTVGDVLSTNFEKLIALSFETFSPFTYSVIPTGVFADIC